MSIVLVYVSIKNMDIMMEDKPLIQKRRKGYFLIALVAILMIVVMSYSFYSSSQMINKYAPLVDATMEIKLEATTAHLWFEEIISGDRYENLDDVIKHIDLALWYANAMLEGGENQEGHFIRLTDNILREEIVEAIDGLNEFKSITFKRYQAKESSGVGSEIDQIYDALFNVFIDQIDHVETLLQQKIKQYYKQYQIIQALLIVAIIALSIIGFISQYRHQRDLANNLIKINQAKTKAEKKEQWLSTIMNSMGDGVITTDIAGNVTRINPVAEELTGWTLSEAKEKSLKTIFPIIDATTRESIANPVDKVILTGETVYLTNHTTLIAKDGSEYQIADSAAPIRDSDNNILGMVLVFNDVTDTYSIREELKRNQQRLLLHWQEAPLGIIEWNLGFELVDLNPAAELIFGFSKEELLGQHITKKILPEEIRETTDKISQQLIENTGGRRQRYKHITKDGRSIICEWYNSSLVNDEGDVVAFSSLVMDVTDSQIAEDKLRLSARVFTDTQEGIMITNAQATIINVNPAFCDITGYSYSEVVGQNCNILSSGKQAPEFYAQMWQILRKYGHWQGEVWNRTKQGEVYAELLSISSILDEDNNVLQYVGIFTDITESKKQQEKLQQMAHYDVLTQLPNRVLLTDRFIQALAHSKRKDCLLAVCFLDLDNFKPINDTYGHEAGDQLLVDVSVRIKKSIRDEDTVSRQGGDEFVLLLGGIESFYQCELMLKRVLDSLAQPYFINGQAQRITASIGVSLYPTDNANLDTLMRHADQAMYQAKQTGRNRYHFFNAEQDLKIIQKHVRLQEIQQALNNNEFCLYYQPKVNMTTGEVFAVEALIRWLHPEKGVIPPLEFLPIIEGSQLEILIGRWVINEALKQLSSWDEQGIELEISINISPYHLQQQMFVAELENALALFPAVKPQYLQLEILESSALGDLKSVNSILKDCINALGVNIALDDFGTGYSSLTHLRNLPAKTIKIDQSFVRDMLDDPNDQAIIEGILGLANAFNRRVIAEGVETNEHGLMLIIMGCLDAQGYGIARPMSIINLHNWLDSYTPNNQWLACAKKSRTLKQDKLELIKLTIGQWHKNLKNKLDFEPNTNMQRPILNRNNCHCGVWIKREKEEQLFDESYLAEMETAHNSFHDKAEDLLKIHAKAGKEDINNALNDLQLAIDHIKNICENIKN